jgi:hypothetical protein
MADRAYRCWLTDQPDLGEGVVAAATPSKARYIVALSAHDAGYLGRANPSQVSCLRAKEYDGHHQLIGGRFIGIDVLESQP